MSTRPLKIELMATALLVVCLMSLGVGGAAASSAPLTISVQATSVSGETTGTWPGGYATATLAGAPSGSPAPTGTVTFNVYGPFYPLYTFDSASCVGTPAFTSTVPVNPAGTGAMSGTFAPPVLKMEERMERVLLFTASYSGDTTYAPVASQCDEPGSGVEMPILPIALPEILPAPKDPGLIGSSTPPSRVAPSEPTRELPIVSNLSFAPRMFLAARRTRAPSKRTLAPPGTMVAFRLSQPGAVTVTINLIVRGRRHGKRCLSVSPTTPWPGASCWTERKVGELQRHGEAGVTRFHFAGRLGRRALAAGAYVAHATASSAPGTTSASFRIAATG